MIADIKLNKTLSKTATTLLHVPGTDDQKTLPTKTEQHQTHFGASLQTDHIQLGLT